jgi:hypothetical protein
MDGSKDDRDYENQGVE